MSDDYDDKLYVVISATVPPAAGGKAPSDTLRIVLDYSQWLAVNEQVTSISCIITPVTVPALLADAGLIQANYVGLPGAIVVYNFTGGVYEQQYSLAFTIGTNAVPPRVKTDTLALNIDALETTNYPGGYPTSNATERGNPPTVWLGAGTPWVGLGADGDFFFDEAEMVIFGPRAGGVWPVVPSHTMPPWFNPQGVV